MEVIGKSVVYGTTLFINASITGWTLSVLWGWFAAPIFGLRELTGWQAYGLALIVSYLTVPIDYARAKEMDDVTGAIRVLTYCVTNLFRSLIMLVAGAIVRNWI